MIVIDASALVKYLLEEDGLQRVGPFIHGKRPLYSVDHVLKECLNALWKHCYLRRVLGVDTVMNIVRGLMKLVDTGVIVLEDERKYLEEALEISLRTGITVYDALYVAQALRYRELLTADRGQAEVARSMGIHVYLV